jgi:hypothetical protein
MTTPPHTDRVSPRGMRLLICAVGLAMAAAGAAATTAVAGPEFKPTGGTFTGTAGASLLQANNQTEEVLCTANTASGAISSATLAGKVIVKFTGCTSTSPTKANCSISSKNSGVAGSITTETLHGVLGTILPAKEVGFLLLPVSGKKITTLQENACTVESQVTGNVVGVIEPVGKSQTTGKLVFTGSSSKQCATDFDPTTGGLVLPGLVAFGTTASEEATESLSYSVSLEVT